MQGSALGTCKGMASTPEATSPDLLEMREYTLKPEGIKPFMALTNDMAGLRRQLLPFLGYVLRTLWGHAPTHLRNTATACFPATLAAHSTA